jgi:hypothetical protein
MSKFDTTDSELDLGITMAVFSTPGAGMLRADGGEEGDEDGDQKGPITYGTTCWGTPCPTNSTVPNAC